MKISSVYQIPADKYNKLLAEALKQIDGFKSPEWVAFVKTGLSRKRPSQEKDFWYKRSASILRQIYINKVVGVNRLRTRYGGRYNRGMRPERFRKASGKIIRVILQQAETVGFLEKYNEPGIRAGRRLTPEGKEFLENIKEGAVQVSEKPVSKEQIFDNKLNEPTETKIIEKDIDKAEKEIAEDVSEGSTNEEIKQDIKEVKEEIKQDIKEVKEEIKQDIEETKTEENK